MSALIFRHLRPLSSPNVISLRTEQVLVELTHNFRCQFGCGRGCHCTGNRAAAPKQVIPTPALLLAMLQAGSRVSDLIFSPASLPHVELSGQLVPVKIPGLTALTAEDTHRIASELIGNNQQAMAALATTGLLRYFLQLARTLPLSRQHFYAARKPRDCDARHSEDRAHISRI